MTKPNTQSYFYQRMKTLGIKDENNDFEIESKGEDGKKYLKKGSFFEADEDDNIVINYYQLNQSRVMYKKQGNKWASDFVRKRLKNPTGDFKYSQPKGSGQHPFFPKGLLIKYKNKTPIKTLILTEGEFKAFKGDMCGFDIVGLPSIHGIYGGDAKGELHFEIRNLIINCNVEKVVFLTDADTLQVNWAKDKDLSKRPSSFYNAVKYMRESMELLLEDTTTDLKDIYFMQLHNRLVHEDAKGLDDLLCKFGGVKAQQDIQADLKKFQFANDYFSGFIITDGKLQKVFKHFGLLNVEEFYTTYKSQIGSREFLFRNRRYEFNGEVVKYVRHEDSEKFMRIGADWVKVIKVPNKYGEAEEEIIPWKIGELLRDYKRFPDFLDNVAKYDSFCNEPKWNDDYRRVHNDCYNICAPLTHTTKEGDFPNTARFLKHIFQGEGTIDNHIIGDQFTVALDYLTLLYQKPKQMLPVPILVSPENGTGKSTFLKWLQAIYASNMAILGNAQFQMKFNAHYITKYIIAIDEGFLEVDKKAEKERLKQLATADTVYMELKGINLKKIPYYGKLMICSNDADRVMKIEDGESRWFVVRVPVIPRESKDPDLEEKMKNEIPAFLNFLTNREVFHPKTDRLWFSPDQFETEQFKIIVETTKNRTDRVFENWIKEQFLLFKLPVLRLPMTYLIDTLNDPKKSKYKIDEVELKAYLKDRKDMKPEKTQRIKIPRFWGNVESENIEPSISYENQLCRPYVFKFEDWLNEEETEEFKGLTKC